MSVGTKLLQAAAGNAGEVVYVDDVFSTFLWTGDSSGSRSINNGIDLDGEGGLVWIKGRTAAYDHALYDTARGATKEMYSNKTDAQQTNSNALTSFNSNGFSIGDDTLVNNNNEDYVAWTFRKQEKFFDIVTYTGDGNADRQINHNLGSVPGMIIIKKYVGSTTRWAVFHRSLGTGKFLSLDDTAGVTTQSDFWQTAPTATQFTVETNGNVNNNGDSYVAYLFGHNEAEYGENSDEAIIYCDSFTTTSTWGSFKADIGFEPQWIIVKRADGASDWIVLDSMRGVAGPGDQPLVDTLFGQDSDDQELKANSSGAESTQGRGGFYSKGYLGNLGGIGNATYVYMAIRRPNKPASEFTATDLFTLQAQSPGEGADTFISTGFDVDTVIYRSRASSATSIGDRLRGQSGGGDFLTNSTDAEGTNTGAFFLDHSDGVTVDYAGGHFNISPAATDKNYIRYFFRRAKGFFDVVAYAGTGSDRTQTHNLGVAPELILIKRRNGSADWIWYVSALGAGKYMYGDGGAELSSTTIFSNTAPTASVFSLGNQGGGGTYRLNGSGDTYIAYLWATVTGISKVGSYTGTGSDLNVDCGFSAGARFILIKRTDSSSDGWYIYDSARGIVAGNDPYVLLNSTNAEVTNTDYIDPLSSGFTVTSSAPADLNASSGTYIFLAIA